MKTTIGEYSVSPPPSYSSLLDQIDNQARGNTGIRMKEDDGNNDEMDLEYLLFTAISWIGVDSEAAIP